MLSSWRPKPGFLEHFPRTFSQEDVLKNATWVGEFPVYLLLRRVFKTSRGFVESIGHLVEILGLDRKVDPAGQPT